ncbi:T-cell receptor gamma alternate reading frame protein [Lissotriton helveticus]
MLLNIASFWAHMSLVWALKLKQQDISITKGAGKMVVLSCRDHDGEVSSTGLLMHWYRRGGPEKRRLSRLLYHSSSIAVHLAPELSKDKVYAEQRGDSYTLIVSKLQRGDSGDYYCACWDQNSGVKYFGTGTRLVVTDPNSPNTEAKAPKAKILPPSLAEIQSTGHLTYLCHLSDFFPEVIKVTWTEEGGTTELEALTGEVKENINTHLYSVSSWLTVPKAALNKRYVCYYQHEGIQTGENKGKIMTTLENGKSTTIEKPESKILGADCPPPSGNTSTALGGTEGADTLSPETFRVAYFTYLSLLLTSALYCTVLLFCICRARVVSRAKAKNLEPQTSSFAVQTRGAHS